MKYWMQVYSTVIRTALICIPARINIAMTNYNIFLNLFLSITTAARREVERTPASVAVLPKPDQVQPEFWRCKLIGNSLLGSHMRHIIPRFSYIYGHYTWLYLW